MTDQEASNEAEESSELDDILLGIVGDTDADASDTTEPKEDTKTEDDPPSKKTEDSTSEPKEDDKKDTTEDSPKEDKSKESAKFDSEKYKKLGITDEKALSELQKLSEQVHEKNKTIGKQGNEVAEARKKVSELKEQRKGIGKQELSDEEFNELNDENPAEARRRSNEAQDNKKEYDRIQAEENRYKAKALLYEKIENFDDLINDIADIILEDHPDLPKSDIAQFKADPFQGQIHPSVLFNLAKRAEFKKNNTTNISNLETENKSLKEKLTQLEAKLKNNSSDVLNKIDDMTKNNINLPADNGSDNNDEDDNIDDLLLY